MDDETRTATDGEHSTRNESNTAAAGGSTRRRLLRTAAVGTAAVAGVAGVASAGGDDHVLQYNFYGCSQVCVDDCGARAVIWNGEELVKREITRRSNRNDPPVRGWDTVKCYEVRGGKAIVGVTFEGEFVSNPNRCAQNYPPQADH